MSTSHNAAIDPGSPAESADESYAIEIVNLTRRFGEVLAVDHVSLNVRYGSIFGLLGPNGAGKSTIIKMLTTLLDPTSGFARVAGFDIFKSPAEVRRRIGYVPQLLSADGALTGYENLNLSAKLYRIPDRKQRISEALQFMGLSDSASRLAKTYSGGMIRRLELAQAMLHRPVVLILDEPTIGLDPVARQTVWDRLLELRSNYQMTVLITTHAMEEADELCDHLAILHLGKVAAIGKPADLKTGLGPTATLNDVFVHYSGEQSRRKEVIVTSVKPAEQQTASVDSSPVSDFFRYTAAITEVELLKVTRDPTELLARAVQPVLWLVVFGEVFSRVRGIPTGDISYMAFLTPGILAQSVLFAAIFYGVAVVWERDLGVVHKLLVSPAPRSSLVFGKAVSAGCRGAVQACVIYLTVLLLGVGVSWNIFSVLGVFLAVMLGSAIFATFSLIIACLVKSRERFMGIGQLMTMPLFFASNAIYPISLMPRWLRYVAIANPLTYLVDLLRGLMVPHAQTIHGSFVNFFVLGFVLVLLLAVATKLYPSLAR